MIHVHCQWLTWTDSMEKHSWEPLKIFWASQESEGELLGSFQGTMSKGTTDMFRMPTAHVD
eukprot:3359716-Karenia_brevis.AAC.1